jgi:hypothetical protein
MLSPAVPARLVHLLAFAALAACGGAGSGGSTATADGTTTPDAGAPAQPRYEDPKAGFDDAARAELLAHGFGKYLNAFQPSRVDAGDTTTTYTFAPDEHGPICMQGAPFMASARDGASDDLLIYLQGGGACWTGTCAASTTTSGGAYPIGWTDGDARNPLSDFDLLNVGYCDGSVFAGDGEVHDPANGAPDGIRYHHGLANLSAALDLGKKRWPSPRRIVLAGSSAGGYGTILATAVVRLVWPKTDLFVIDDAGPGLTNPAEPSQYATILKEWNLAARIPPSCAACQDGQFTPFIGWSLEHDPTIRAGLFSSYEDDVIGQQFLGMTGPGYAKLLVAETGAIHASYPWRFERYLVDGAAHTALLAGFYDMNVDNVPLPEWTRRMIDDESDWYDALEPAP